MLMFTAFLVLAAFAVLFRMKPDPDVTFKTITGETIPLASWRGKPAIVLFWATDCPSCIREIPHWQQLYRQFHPLGLELIAVSMFYDPPSRVVAFAKAENLPYPVALDVRGELAEAFGRVELTPTTFIIASDGKIVRRITGTADAVEIKNLVEQLLTE